MKILFIVFNQVGDSSHIRASRFADHLSRRGHTVTVMGTSRTNRLQVTVSHPKEKVTQIDMPDLLPGMLRSGWDLWNIFNRIGWLRDKDFDIVHSVECRPTVIYPALFMHNRGIPLVIEWSDWFGKGGSVEERPNPIVRTILRPVETFYEEHFRTRADGSTVICSVLEEKLIGLGVRPETILYLPNGADTDRYQALSVDVARARLNIAPDIPIVGWMGRLFQHDAQLMVDSFNELVKLRPDARLLVVGKHNYDFKKMVSRPENVMYTGYLKDQDLNLYLSACDVFWLPIKNTNANRGRFPYKLTHFMAMERPIITSPVGDIPKVFQAGDIGSLVPDDQPEAYAASTIHLLSQPERRTAMGKKARKLVEEQFNWATLTEKLEQFYMNTIEKHSTARRSHSN